MVIASVSSAAFLLVTDLSIIELDQSQLIEPQVEAAEVIAVKADAEKVSEESADSVDAVAASWATDAVKRRRRD